MEIKLIIQKDNKELQILGRWIAKKKIYSMGEEIKRRCFSTVFYQRAGDGTRTHEW